MKTISISFFKSHALQIIANIAKNKERIVITKRGVALAEILPFGSSKSASGLGKLAHTLISSKDIVSPLGESDWEASA